MANTVANVTTGKPAVTGAIYRAPLSSTPTIPTDAVTALGSEFKALGYASDDGLTNTNSPETDEIKAWGGDVVLTPETGKPDEFNIKLIESLNVDVIKTVYGANNVTGTISTGLTVKANSDAQEEACWVFETILRGNILKRIVIPDAVISEIGDIIYKDDEAIGYELKLKAMPDSAGQTHYEYLKSA